MNRDEFMEKLEYLLSDIPEEEKADALAYYRDYLEEAGENAGEVIREFGRPERIASIIRTELAGNLEDGGAFTERGYEDDRFKEPNYQVARRLNLPEERGENSGGAWKSAPAKENRQKEAPRTSRTLKIVLWIILLIAASPFLLGAGGVAGGMAIAAMALLVGAVAVLGVLTLALMLAGAGLCVVGILAMLRWLPGGILMFGAGVVVIGLGILSLLVSILFYGKFIPWLFRGVVDIVSRMVHGRRKEG